MKMIKLLFITFIAVNLCYGAHQADLAPDKHEHRLIDSVCAGNIKTVQQLLNSKTININAKDEYGYTALMLASFNDQIEIAKLLLAHKSIDVNVQDKDGYTTLMWALLYEQTEVVKLLLARNANVYIKSNSGLTVLELATKKGHKEIERIIKKHTKVN